MTKDVYDFGGAGEREEVIETPEAPTEEVIETPAEEVKDENPTEELNDEIKSEDEPTDSPNNGGDTDEIKSNIDKESEALDKELAELEEILKGGSNPGDSDGMSDEVSGKLQDSVKTIKSLMGKIDKLELEKAEAMKFGENAGLSPELIIMKANYEKAKKGDEQSISKIKELIASDLGLEVTNQKQVFVSSSIRGGTDVNVDKSEEQGFGGFVM